MPSIKHAHTYARIKGKKHFYRCIHPDCTFHANRELLKGKRATCKCGREFIISERIDDKHLRRAELKCDICLGLVVPIVPNEIMDVFTPQAKPAKQEKFEFEEPMAEKELEIDEDDSIEASDEDKADEKEN